MQDAMSDYARRDEVSLPSDLRTARIDRDAFECLTRRHARTSHCIPWRNTKTGLLLLLPGDVDELAWESLVRLARVQLSHTYHARDLTFRSSGLETKTHLEVLEFLYKRAASNISCVNMFEFVCPMKWEALSATHDPAKRHCHQCQRDVHLVANEQEFENRAQTGDCVAYSPPESYTEALAQPVYFGRPSPPNERHLSNRPNTGSYGAISFEEFLASETTRATEDAE